MSDAPLKFGDGFAKADRNAWQGLAEKTLGGKPFEKVMRWHSSDSIPFDALSVDGDTDVMPQPTRTGPEWLIVSPNWGTDPARMNADILEDLARGSSAIALTVDENGFMGIKPGELSRALEGVYLDMVPFFLVQGGDFTESVSEMAALLMARAYTADQVSGSLGIDPIGVLARTGNLSAKIEDKISEAAASAKDWASKYPLVNSFNVDATVYANAGASEATELAAAMTTAVTYLKAMEQIGLSLDQAARQISFTFSANANQWLTIAKFRTARRIWQQILTACGVEDVPAKISAVSAVNMVSQKDPWVNILRGTSACFGAAVGGADTVTTLPHDLMLGTTNKFSRRIARNIQIILQEESNLAKVTDPAAGSYALEAMTNGLEDKAMGLFQEIEQKGGMVACLRSGWLQEQIRETAAERLRNIRTRKTPLTGVSEYPNIAEPGPDNAHSVPKAVGSPVGQVVETVEALNMMRLSQDFEKLRHFSDDIVARDGTRPSVFLANIGNPADFTGRATFAKNFFEAGGFITLDSAGGILPDEIAKGFDKSGVSVAVLCSTDSLYQDHAADIANALKAAGCKYLFVAGKPENIDQLTASGVDECIYIGCDVVSVNESAYKAMGYNVSGDGA